MSRQQFVGESRLGTEPYQPVELNVDEIPKLTQAEKDAGILSVDGDYEPGNVLRYGAVADNSTDCLAAFDKAQIVAGQGGASGSIGIPVIIPAGKYVLSGEWLVDEARVVRGEGKYLSLLKFQTGSTNGVRFTKNDVAVHGIGVCNSYGNGIKADKISRASFDDILVSPFTDGYCIYFLGGFENTLENYHATTNGQQPWLTSESDVSSHTNVNQHGIYAEEDSGTGFGTSANVYRSCICSGMYGSGFKSIGDILATGSAPVKSYGLIEGCTFEGNGLVSGAHQIDLDTISHLEIIGTHIEGTGDNHLKVYNCIRCIFHSISSGVHMTGTVSGNNFRCSDNIFIGGLMGATSSISADVYRTKFYNTFIEQNFVNLNRTTEYHGCSNSRVSQKVFSWGTVTSNSRNPINDNIAFNRWLTSTLPEGYVSEGGATFSRITSSTLSFLGPDSCRVTAIGTSAEEGIKTDIIPKEYTAREEYLTISAEIRKTSAFSGNIQLRALLGTTVRSVDIDLTPYPDDTWFPVKATFGQLGGNPKDKVAYILMSGSPPAGRFFEVDAFEVSRGEGSYTHGDLNANEMRNLYLNDQRVTSAASIPTTGNYIQGDFVYNTAPSIDGNNMILLGWSRITTGSAHVSNTDWGLCYVSTVTPAT